MLAPALATSTFCVPLLMRSRFLGLRSNWLRSILPTTLSSGLAERAGAGSACGAGVSTTGSGSGCATAGSGSTAGSSTGSGSATGSACGASGASGSSSTAGAAGSAGASGSAGAASGSSFTSGTSGAAGISGSGISFLALMNVLLLMIVSCSGSSSSSTCSRPERWPLFSRISVILTSTLSAACFSSRSLPNCLLSAGRYSSETFALGSESTSTPCFWRKPTRSSRPMLNCLSSLLILISAILSSLRILL